MTYILFNIINVLDWENSLSKFKQNNEITFGKLIHKVFFVTWNIFCLLLDKKKWVIVATCINDPSECITKIWEAF